MKGNSSFVTKTISSIKSASSNPDSDDDVNGFEDINGGEIDYIKLAQLWINQLPTFFLRFTPGSAIVEILNKTVSCPGQYSGEK